MDRMEKLEEERYKTQVLLLEEKNKLKGKYNKLAEEHEKLVEEHKKMEEEHSKLKEKHNKLEEELRANVECPVCLATPTVGPMASCPRGHLVCLPCHRTMVGQGMENCPNCREPMGNNMNLLAKTVIENIEHECTNEGCHKMLPHNEVSRHKEQLCIRRKVSCPEEGCEQMLPFLEMGNHRKDLCNFRKVLCPGNSSSCKATLPFCALNDHFKVCTSVGVGYQGTTSVRISKDYLNRDGAKLKTKIFKLANEVFAVQTRIDKSKMSFGVLMLADREKCNRFKVTIEIQDDNSETLFSAQFNPDPVDMENCDDASLLVRKTKLAKMVTSDGDRFRYKINMKVSEKRTISD